MQTEIPKEEEANHELARRGKKREVLAAPPALRERAVSARFMAKKKKEGFKEGKEEKASFGKEKN